jgi:hypothetical protein
MLDPNALTATSMATDGSIHTLKLVCGYAVVLFLGLLAATLLTLVWRNKIDLSGLLAEVNGQASVSRFQLVIFTMIIALALFVLTIQDGKFPYISPEILILLGISSSTYAVGKAISFSQPSIMTAQGQQQTVQAISATGAAAIATSEGVAAEGAPNPIHPAP